MANNEDGRQVGTSMGRWAAYMQDKPFILTDSHVKEGRGKKYLAVPAYEGSLQGCNGIQPSPK
eukprot:1149638-Pelagomonas_calceolata.AAC.3